MLLVDSISSTSPMTSTPQVYTGNIERSLRNMFKALDQFKGKPVLFMDEADRTHAEKAKGPKVKPVLSIMEF